jgi:mono/diheme cytochrome c family protein
VPAKKNLFLSLTVVAASLILNGLACQPLHAQDADGIYSADQAKRGEALFKKQCSSCHGEALDGAGPYPALTGNDFLTKYEGQPAVNLYDMIQKLMPATQPGTLSRPDAADLLAYILSFNKFPAGKTDLPNDDASLKKLMLPKPAPKS